MPPSRTDARRSGFALTGRSAAIDPRHDAVRPDLADVRLAARVFAPHYVAAVRRTLVRAADLRDGAADAAPSLMRLAPGSAFELLDVTGHAAWGIAQPDGIVGYVPADALAPASPPVSA